MLKYVQILQCTQAQKEVSLAVVRLKGKCQAGGIGNPTSSNFMTIHHDYRVSKKIHTEFGLVTHLRRNCVFKQKVLELIILRFYIFVPP